MAVGNLKLFRKVIDSVRLQGVVMEEPFFEHLHELAFLDESAKPPVQAANFLLPSSEPGWTASNSLGPAMVTAIEATIREKQGESDLPLKGRVVLLAGLGPLTRMVAPSLKEHGANLIFAGKDKPATQRLSQILGADNWPGKRCIRLRTTS